MKSWLAVCLGLDLVHSSRSFFFLSKLVTWKIVRRVRCRIWRWRKEIREERTGASTQSRNAFSRPWHPPAAPPAAQQSVTRNRLSVKGEPVQRKPKKRDVHVLSIAVIGPIHGLGFC